ncbi:MAG: NAD-dependent epimerase/dehydratase family protein [Desulfosarcina sp.]|nr:NAD-dependent epimerase/dehydratase family protein [Desulfobacterales bacterium]
MSSLIYGASGFVANNLISMLSRFGRNHFILIDKAEKPEIPDDIFKGCKVDLVKGEKLIGLIDDSSIEEAVCLAGATSVDAGLDNPAETMRNNLDIAVEFGEWLRLNPHIRAVYMSSDEVLGPSSVPLAEEAPLLPSQPYAASKAAGEMIIHNYRDVYGISVSTLRSCNLIGKGQRQPKLLPTAVDCLLRNKPVPIHGDGLQKREWLAVEDICTAIEILLRPGIRPAIYQACSGYHRSVLDVVSMIAETLGHSFAYKHVKDRRIQDNCYAMQSDRIQSIGWRVGLNPATAIKNAGRGLATKHL